MEETIDSPQQATVEPHKLRRDIIYRSAVMANFLKEVDQVAASKTTVLITGDTGTGKELIAQRLHEKSPRKDGPYEIIDCTTIPKNLIESELFGHEKGAFTNAIQKIGKFEHAMDGTILLDEIGELPLEMQAKLLRVIQDKTITRVGGLKTIGVGVRILAATNRNLEQEVAKGNFRHDLLFRLNVCSIHIPPLRDRVDDIPILINYFVNKFNDENGRSIANVDEALTKALIQYPWPGNVRELGSLIEGMMSKVSGGAITLDHIPSKYLSVGDTIAIKNMPSPEDLAASKPHEVKKIVIYDGIQMPHAKSYRSLCDWILKELKQLKADQIKDPLKTVASHYDIWQAKAGVGGIGRDLIKVLKTYPELFQDLDTDGIKSIFDLLFYLSPSFKKEKTGTVEIILKDWSTYKTHNEAINNVPKPKITLTEKYDLIKGSEFRSSRSMIETDRVVIVTKIWDIVGQSNTTVQFKRFITSFMGQNDDYPPIEIMTNAETTQPFEQRNELQIGKGAIYYLTVSSVCSFEVNVYEVTW